MVLDDAKVVAALHNLVLRPRTSGRRYRVVALDPLLERVAREHGVAEAAARSPLIKWVEAHGGAVHDGLAGFPSDAWAALPTDTVQPVTRLRARNAAAACGWMRLRRWVAALAVRSRSRCGDAEVWSGGAELAG